ncbi:ArsR/SmtB family transcription factor [Liquorilactobacillus mali]|uniref:ArsR/SmtB family transcription factor n=1 Tax=Liquorilactobacillus mali TaxID=1618 RepID=UPI00234FDEEE|nr:metalloregulator ArsR/SmtB family transcription factor [Liquorilactobacillus mali]MDC7952556.1 winged helix-turn-helix transcriptional regulator [Liquorilactobacillus mali]
MNGFPDLQKTTKILADQSRLEILTTLMDGKFHTVNELAKKAKVKSHTTSYHLKQLCQLNWVSSYKQGRNVYYSLSSEDIASLLEKLMNISPTKEVHSFNENSEYQKLKKGRSCYKHLAGNLGVSFFNFLVQNQYIKLENNSLMLTIKGIQYFESIGIEITCIKKQKGIFIKPCLDWTERTFHLSGNLGRAFFNLCEEKNFIILNTGNRSVCLTSSGEDFFKPFKP